MSNDTIEMPLIPVSREKSHMEDPEYIPSPKFVDYYIQMILDTMEYYREYLRDPDFAKEQVPMVEFYRELWLSGKFSMADVIRMSEQWLDVLRKQRDGYASNIENKIRFAKEWGMYREESGNDDVSKSDKTRRESRWSRIWKAITGYER